MLNIIQIPFYIASCIIAILLYKSEQLEILNDFSSENKKRQIDQLSTLSGELSDDIDIYSRNLSQSQRENSLTNNHDLK